MENEKKDKWEFFNDHFQNYKRYQIPKAQLVIADIPYNLGKNAYASSTAYRDWETDRKSTRLNSSHSAKSRMPSSA